MLLSIMLVAFALIIGCSEKTTSPTEASYDDAALQANFSRNSGSKLQADQSSGRQGNSASEYEIMLENLSPATAPGVSQPFSPPILATHGADFTIFKETMLQMSSGKLPKMHLMARWFPCSRMLTR